MTDINVKGILESNTTRGLIVLVLTYAAKQFLGFTDDVATQQFVGSIMDVIMAAAGAWSMYGLRNAVGDTKVKPFAKPDTATKAETKTDAPEL